MKIKNRLQFLSILISMFISGGFLYLVLNPPSAFNFIPYLIHEAFFRDVTAESTFIVIFDIIFAIILVWPINMIIRRIIFKISH